MSGRGGKRGWGVDPQVAGGTLQEKVFAELNPATVLLGRQKELKLGKDQVKVLEDASKRYDWNSRQFVRIADSLDTVLHPKGQRGRGRGDANGGASDTPAAAPSSEAQSSTWTEFKRSLQSIRDEFDLAAKASMDALDSSQRAGAKPLIDKSRATLVDRLAGVGLVTAPAPPPDLRPPG